MTDLDVYKRFLLYAVLGRLPEADALRRLAGDCIRDVADRLAAAHEVPPKPLYRGILLDPAKPYALEPAQTFLSWSEDPDVARWFACPRSVVSEPLAATNNKLRGYLIHMPVFA